jgi:hypothetical protein
MSQTYQGGPITVQAVGFTAATGASSARTAIPVDSAGNLPRYIRVAGINECYVKLGGAAVAATANDMLIQPADSAILTVNGQTNIAYIQGTAAGKVNVVPLENV